MAMLFCKRYFQWKFISSGLIIMLLMTVLSYKNAIASLQTELEQAREVRSEAVNIPDLAAQNIPENPRIKWKKPKEKLKPKTTLPPTTTTEKSTTTTNTEAPEEVTTTTSTTTTTTTVPVVEQKQVEPVLPVAAQKPVVIPAAKPAAIHKMGEVYKIEQSPYDSTRGTPTDPSLISKRDTVRGMMKFAWDGYKEKAWGYNEVKPDSGRPSTNNIFGAAKTGASIIDALDTLWIMGLHDEFKDGAEWVRTDFNLRVANQMLSCFETVIRFLGGLLGAYHMSGDEMLMRKAVEVAEALDPAFNDSPLPAAHFNPSNGKTDYTGGRILSEIGSFHLEYYDLAFASGNKLWYDRAHGIRKVLQTVRARDGLYANRISRPKKGSTGVYSAQASSGSISFGAEGDSYYEYLIKAFYQSNKKDLEAKDLYDKSIEGAKRLLVKESPSGNKYLSDYPASGASMQHLACFAGGMIAYGAKDSTMPKIDQQLGADITETCSLSYRNSPSHIGSERFSTYNGVTVGSPAYYILRPEVVESYFYLWRITKEQKYRDWAWEAVQAIEQHCKSKYGYSGLRSVNTPTPSKDDLQRSFFLAETLKYLYLIFSEDDLISLDEFVFNTEAHPLIITK